MSTAKVEYVKKPLKCVLIRENRNPIDYVHCCVIGCHGKFEQKSQL